MHAGDGGYIPAWKEFVAAGAGSDGTITARSGGCRTRPAPGRDTEARGNASRHCRVS